MDQSTVYELNFVMLRITHRSQTVDLNENLKNAFEVRFWSQKWRFLPLLTVKLAVFASLTQIPMKMKKGKEKAFRNR